MAISKSKDLLGQLSQLERTVSEFSFEELNANDAKELKDSFNAFRSSLEKHIYTPKAAQIVPKKIEVEADGKKELSEKQFIANVSHEIRTPLNLSLIHI